MAATVAWVAQAPPWMNWTGCCQTHDNCYTQAKHLKECKVLIDNPYTNSYSFSCSGNEVTCSGRFTLGALWALLGY
ncbi:Phospholipase A2 [Lemmus lemmus]